MSLSNDLREVWRLGGLSPKQLVRRVYVQINRDDIWGYAAQLAFYYLFSIFPFFIFLAALLAYIPIPNLLDQIMELLQSFLPEQVFSLVEQNVRDLLTQPRGGLLSVGIFLALWMASSAIAAITNSLNQAYGVSESRPFWKVRGMAILLTIGLAVLVIGSIVLLIFGPELGGWLADYVGLGRAFDVVWALVRWPVIVVLLMLATAMLYYFAPDVEQDWRWITPGAVFAILAWVVASLAFAWYVDHFGEYDRTYGSIGAVIVLLTWMYLSGFVLLVGGEINAEIEHASAAGKNFGEKRYPRHPAPGRRADVRAPARPAVRHRT